jgi:hypothetical protein
LSYPLSNEKAVVSECSEETDMDGHLRQCVMAVPYDDLVRASMYLVCNEGTRKSLARHRFETFSREDQVSSLKDAIALTKFPQPHGF